MDLQTFHSLPVHEVSRRVQAAGKSVCVFPIEGTRRWFLLEKAQSSFENYLSGYFDAALKRHVELFTLLFDHGLTTLVAPLFGNFILTRSPLYVQKAVEAIVDLAVHPTMVELYRHYDIRVRFYGDYRSLFQRIGGAHIADAFDELVQSTSTYQTRRIFYGLFEEDPLATIVQHTLRYFDEHGEAPDRRALIEMYYGEAIPPFDLYIGYDRFSADDMPLLATGNQDLFFMMAPTLSLTQDQLRSILHAHIYSPLDYRPDYATVQDEQLEAARADYQTNKGRTFRVAVQPASGEVTVTRAV